ncbi:hypothetical protein [Georgenia sp. 311]|uniref:hypothetical protein n=1 Tax=Georgenia sp. 311 TaxID=2585134 RepID=UPI001C3F20B6|nr:hypothetical protein [Georgenia sp. 311]
MTDLLAQTDISPDQAPARRTPPPWAKMLGLTAGLGIVLVLLLAVFIMPALKSGPTDLPLGVVATDATATSIEETLTASAPGSFDLERFDSADALTEAVRGREVAGGFVVDGAGVEAVVASAGSTAISSTISATAEMLAAASSTGTTVTDVVPLPDTDPTGIGIGGLAFPLVFGGIVPAVAFRTIFPRNNGWKLAGILTFSVVGGLVVATVLRFVFGSIDTSFWPVTGAMALGIASLAMPLAGLQEALGSKGFTLSAMVMMFLGNPLAGIATTSAWLPPVLGTFGQLLPPGAAGTLVRSAAYFDGAGGLTAALTLVTWFVLGLVVHTVGVRRKARAAA